MIHLLSLLSFAAISASLQSLLWERKPNLLFAFNTYPKLLPTFSHLCVLTMLSTISVWETQSLEPALAQSYIA